MSDVRPSWSLSSLSSLSSSLLRPEVKTPEHNQSLCEYPNCLNAWHMSQNGTNSCSLVFCFVLWRHLFLSCLHLELGIRRSMIQASPIALFPQTTHFTPLCFSSPRCINGYWRFTVGGNPVMEQHPIQGEVAILLGMLHAKEIGTSSHRFGLQLVCIFTLYLFTFLFPGLARAKSVPTKTYSNEVVTLWYVVINNIT